MPATCIRPPSHRSADPGGTGDSIGMFVNDFLLEWQRCDLTPCVPGVAGGATPVVFSPSGASTSVTGGTSGSMGATPMSVDP